MRITVIGCGHVGLVTAGCLATIGHHVLCVDHDANLLDLLEDGKLPIYETHLDRIVQHCRADRTLTFSRDLGEAANAAEVVFLCVGVPQLESGDSDFSALDTVARQIAKAVDTPKLVVVRSTVPVQTGRKLEHLLSVYGRTQGPHFSVAANPPFLRVGAAVRDFLHPDRIILGVEDPHSEKMLRQIYGPILKQSFPCPIHHEHCPQRIPPQLLLTDIHSAELIKHASNTFLGIKISYANVLADLCEQLGADVQEVTQAVGLDRRIGPGFMEAGIGFGGSRLPTDLRAFCRLADRVGADAGIPKAAERVNRSRVDHFFEKVQRSLWVLNDKRIGLLGLSHKPDTNDISGSPAIELWKRFTAAGACVCAYDPQAMGPAHCSNPEIVCLSDPYDVADRADALVIATDWQEFLNLDWKRIREVMARPAVFDGRNLLSPAHMKALGFEYVSVGRPQS